MTTRELERILKEYKIVKSRRKRREAESISMPFMLTTFSSMIVDEVPPTQKDFIDNFRKLYPQYRILGIADRLKRAYASYIQEYHLGYLLKDLFGSDNVIHSDELDLSGIDYIVKYKGLEFNLHAFVDTPSGRYWRKVKNGRHVFKGIHLNVPLNYKNSHKVGELSLYTREQIKELKEKMNKIVSFSQ